MQLNNFIYSCLYKQLFDNAQPIAFICVQNYPLKINLHSGSFLHFNRLLQLTPKYSLKMIAVKENILYKAFLRQFSIFWSSAASGECFQEIFLINASRSISFSVSGERTVISNIS